MEAPSTVEPPVKVTTVTEAIANAPASAEAMPAIIKVAAAEEARTPTEAVEPRAGADKKPAGEPLRPVVAVGRACVWVVIIVAVAARRGWANVRRPAESDADHNSLRLCVRCRNQADAKYCEKS
jgi:hypothetical protein